MKKTENLEALAVPRNENTGSPLRGEKKDNSSPNPNKSNLKDIADKINQKQMQD